MPDPVSLGILLPMVGRGLDARELLAELTEEVQAAEAAGLDVVLVPEHHAGPPGMLKSPLTVVTWLLARTSRIRIGTGVLLLPLHSTIAVAEAAALLQLASGGRFILGVGAGYQPADFDLFGIDRSRRVALLEEGMHRLRRSLAGDAPPPVWLGAWSAAGVWRAASIADGWIADPVRSAGEVVATTSTYRQALADSGRAGEVILMREGWVDTTGTQARATYGPAVETIYRYYLRNGAFPADSGLTEAELTLDGALADRVVIGSSAEVAAQMADLIVATGASTVVLALRHPHGPAHKNVLTAIGRLGTEVRPHLQSLLASREGIR
jgi:alkanesulfonate monooxygenase SsuD/methylene tetrahydromethanopterin reductase-like flavin-dependent oxidoreductase (luciferase family)